MRYPEVIVVKKRSPLKVIFIVLGSVVAFAAALAVAYKLWGEKLLKAAKILCQVDLDGDGEAEAVMLDTTGDGEVDTIIIHTDTAEPEVQE